MFYEDNNFLIGAGAGLVVGMLIMWAYQWFKHKQQIKNYQNFINQQSATIELHERTKYDWISKIHELDGIINELKTLDPLLQKQHDDYKKWREKTTKQVERFSYLRTVISKLEIKASVKESRETKATKKNQNAELQAVRTEAKNKDDAEIEELKKRSKGINTKPKQ